MLKLTTISRRFSLVAALVLGAAFSSGCGSADASTVLDATHGAAEAAPLPACPAVESFGAMEQRRCDEDGTPKCADCTIWNARGEVVQHGICVGPDGWTCVNECGECPK